MFAVAGTNTVSFAVDAAEAYTQGLLGFAIERHDHTDNESYFLYGFKVFESVIPQPAPETIVSTRDHPVQSFVTDDFTAKPAHRYTYTFHPLRGSPKNLDRSAQPIVIGVETEADFSTAIHDVFFNRGVASSQAYRRRFDNKSPTALRKLRQVAKAEEALQWLSRSLDEAFLAFIAQAKKGDRLLGCFYEFRYEPAARALKAALERGVVVNLIVDGKRNGKNGEPDFPREENLTMLATVGLAVGSDVMLREAKPGDIQHNKFMVLLRKNSGEPDAVWTGSANLSENGFHGQTNVGHWVRDSEVAARFRDYFDLLSQDPGPTADDDRKAARQKNDALRTAVDGLDDEPTRWEDIKKGTTPVFSPRPKLALLDLYADLLDASDDLACITLAFGINKRFKSRILDNTAKDQITFFCSRRTTSRKRGRKSLTSASMRATTPISHSDHTSKIPSISGRRRRRRAVWASQNT